MIVPELRTLRDPAAAGELIARLARIGQLKGAWLAGQAVAPEGFGGLRLAGLSADSRRVEPGDCFVAVPGFHVDGHAFVAAAAERGAVLALVERPVPEASIAQLLVTSARRALAEAAAWWAGDPSLRLGIVGITGTDGKTTTGLLAAAALRVAGIRTGLLGTAALAIGGTIEGNPEHVTTPEAPELQAALAAMERAGDVAAVVETTSHGLALDRVAGIVYDAAVLTNLSHEHLDLHGTFEAYRAAKVSLFERLNGGRPETLPAPALGGPPAKPLGWPPLAVVNADDPNASHFLRAARAAGAQVVTYGLGPAAEVRGTAVEETPRGLAVEVVGPAPGRVDLRLVGRFNVANALAVVALGVGLGLDPARVRAGLAGVDRVPGRMERVDLGQPFEVVVDYAHSPAALEVALEALAPLARAGGGGLVAVFGSAGERDRAKRPLMGRIAGERCRLVVLTDEDPRGEDRLAILEEIAAGAEAVGRRRGEDLLLVPDRRAAIRAALERARPGDVVLLAGKGHERSIIGPTGPEPWDERAEAEQALRELGYGAGSTGAG
ncbi:MAG TPA: UDP-N-acetylmuramoyl-L-alanyl-D-glutamate--2,6-diaminopimelate ligase [Candidatus Binatia bacterium]|nr:UDP-N-acetylmuramoyl-L-alanyl-D-glutamate--2,6-diaminopimelate ligase [Candidatus Binatia bacterium]